MKAVENRVPYYCDISRRCVILYSGTSEGGKTFKSCSCVVPEICSGCPIYEHGLENHPRSKGEAEPVNQAPSADTLPPPAQTRPDQQHDRLP